MTKGPRQTCCLGVAPVFALLSGLGTSLCIILQLLSYIVAERCQYTKNRQPPEGVTPLGAPVRNERGRGYTLVWGWGHLGVVVA